MTTLSVREESLAEDRHFRARHLCVSMCILAIVATELVGIVVGRTCVEPADLGVPDSAEVCVMSYAEHVLVVNATKQVNKELPVIDLLKRQKSLLLKDRKWGLRLFMDYVQSVRNTWHKLTDACLGSRFINFNSGGIPILNVLSNISFTVAEEQRIVGNYINCKRFTEIDHGSLSGYSLLWISRELQAHALNSDPRSLVGTKGLGCRAGYTHRGIGGALTAPIDQRSKTNIADCKYSGNPRPKQVFTILGGALFVCGLVVVLKVIDKIYLRSGFNENVAVAVFFFGALLMWLGGGLVLCMLGVV